MGDFYDQTTIHPLAVVVLGFLAVWMLLSPRRQVLLPILVLTCFISPAQRIVLVGLDFTLLKLILIVALTRILVRNELRVPRWNSLDTVVIAWAVVGSAIYTAVHGSNALINRLGWFSEWVRLYLVCRVVLVDWQDLRLVIRMMMWLSIPVACFFVVELLTGRNMFSVFGGIPEITPIREGKLRCQGAFSHPIIAGVFWATVLSLFIPEFWRKRERHSLAAGAIAGSVLTIYATRSSTPMAMLFLAVVGFWLFRWRKNLRLMTWGLVCLLFVLHFAREKPVWHLVSRIDLVGGSTGYHRYLLIDGAINRFWDWWLVGAPAVAYADAAFDDITNEFVREAYRGGLLTLVLFVAVFAVAVRTVSRCFRKTDLTPYQRMLVWGLGVATLNSAVAFVVSSSFGQGQTIWCVLLGVVACLPQLLESRTARLEQEQYRRETLVSNRAVGRVRSPNRVAATWISPVPRRGL